MKIMRLLIVSMLAFSGPAFAERTKGVIAGIDFIHKEVEIVDEDARYISEGESFGWTDALPGKEVLERSEIGDPVFYELENGKLKAVFAAKNTPPVEVRMEQPVIVAPIPPDIPPTPAQPLSAIQPTGHHTVSEAVEPAPSEAAPPEPEFMPDAAAAAVAEEPAPPAMTEPLEEAPAAPGRSLFGFLSDSVNGAGRSVEGALNRIRGK